MDQERTYKWIQDRLRDLHSGVITEADLRRLDEMSATDPFLADALEGYRAHPHIDHTTRINTIAHRIRQKKIIKRRWLIPAMAASLLALIAIWTLVEITKPKDNMLVTVESETTTISDHSVEIPATVDSNYKNITGDNGAGMDLMSRPSGLRADAQSRAKEYAAAKTEANVKADEPSKEEVIADAVVKEYETYTLTEPPAAPTLSTIRQEKFSAVENSSSTDEDIQSQSAEQTDQGLSANQMDPSLMAKRVTGRVISETGTPLYAVNLSVQNTNLGTITDNEGKFELFLPTKQSVVDVMYNGHVDASLTLSQGTENVVITLPTGKLNQQITVGELQKTSNIPAGRPYAPTRPAGSSFTEYLREHSRFPIQEQLNASGNAVTLEFQILSTGRPEDIRIVHSSRKNKFDNEAIRLLFAGPDWECELGLYPCTTQYTIYFE